MNALAVSLVVVMSLVTVGVAAWTWLALTDVSSSLRELDFDGIHFDID